MQPSFQDTIELRELINRYTHILDYGSVDDLGLVWSDNCTFAVDEPAFKAAGLDEVKQMLRGTKASHGHVRHVVTNSYVEFSEGEVRLNSYLQIFDCQMMKVTMFARYIDTCVKTDCGWRIHHRLCLNG